MYVWNLDYVCAHVYFILFYSIYELTRRLSQYSLNRGSPCSAQNLRKRNILNEREVEEVVDSKSSSEHELQQDDHSAGEGQPKHRHAVVMWLSYM